MRCAFTLTAASAVLSPSLLPSLPVRERSGVHLCVCVCVCVHVRSHFQFLLMSLLVHISWVWLQSE